MSAIAIVLAEMGHQVSGSDLRDRPVLERVRAAGVDVTWATTRHVDGCRAVTASTAIPARNIEIDEAARTGIAGLSRAGMLSSICAQAKSLGVAGTHGKTTTSSMLMLILAGAGLRPSFIIGGDVTDMGTGAQWTDREWLVVEADESDGTHLELPLFGTILLNVEVDHLDFFGTRTRSSTASTSTSPRSPGPKVLCIDDPVVRRTCRPPWRDHLRHVASAPTIRAVDVQRRSRVELRSRSYMTARPSARVDLPLRGIHNVRNALGALAMAIAVGVEFDVAARARPSSVVSPVDSTSAASMAARRSSTTTPICPARSAPSSPRRARAATGGDGSSRCSSRTASTAWPIMSPEYRDAFVDADLVVITEIFASGTHPDPRRHRQARRQRRARRPPGDALAWLPRRGDLIDYLARELRDGDVCISMGCGDIASLPDEVLQRRAELRGRVGMSLAERLSTRRPPISAPCADRDVPLGTMTTYRVGGTAAIFVDADARRRELQRVAEVIARYRASRAGHRSRAPTYSSPTPGSPGWADAAWPSGPAASRSTAPWLCAGSAVALPVLARKTAAAGLTGFEWAVGMPGSIGGAVRMNAGGHGSDIAASLVRRRGLRHARHAVRCWRSARIDRAALPRVEPGRQRSRGRAPSCSWRSAMSRNPSGRSPTIVRWRRENQPGGQNAGSVFVNPIPGECRPASSSIGSVCVGSGSVAAFVSEKHANFIQAGEGATATDVKAVIDAVRDRVAAATGFDAAHRSAVGRLRRRRDVDDAGGWSRG